MDLADCYRLLGLRTGASYEDIKASYRRLARQYHPDANPHDQQQANEKFIQLTEAYRRLTSVVQPSRPTDRASSPTVDLKQNRDRPAAASPATPQTSPATPPRKSPSIRVNPDLTPAEQQLKQQSYEQLQQFLKERRFPRAVALVEGLAQRLPNDVEVRQWKAITYQRFGRFLITANQLEKAKIYLRKALQTDPRNKSLSHEIEQDFRRIDRL
jgi:curved DNA-binding protein CbpA